MREQFVSGMVQEVLGPRGGLREVLDESPLSEYITGVLAPDTDSPGLRSVDDEAVIPVEGGEEAEDSEADPEPHTLGSFSPVLDPQGRPHSLGVTFVAHAGDDAPGMHLCATWARYREEDSQGHARRWIREPRAVVLRGIPGGNSDHLLRPAPGEDPEVSVHIRSRPHPGGAGLWMVSVFLVNRIRPAADTLQTAGHHVFQPQVRIRLPEGVQTVSGIAEGSGAGDERTLRFLYRERPALARGHLCSAVWRAVDPEVEVLGAGDPVAPATPPFVWTDGELLAPPVQQEFTGPDVRSEYVPLFPVTAPELDLDPQWGPAPELRAAVLAEAWDGSAIRAALRPLVDGYGAWISARAQEAPGTPDPEVAHTLVLECEEACRRLEAGIDLLVQDDQVRLAFCFAMKAIDLQSGWAGGRGGLMWRPFQLAFVILSLESIANPASADRDVCDLLWVATGAGKTEAYLALAAFTMAYRRLRAAAAPDQEDQTGGGVAVISRYTLRLLTIQQFRRALRMVSACELLRVHGLGSAGPTGWRPVSCPERGDMLWGSIRFSAGLWVGGGVTPNRLTDSWAQGTIPGALSILAGAAGEGEPAQVVRCPACDSILSVPRREEDGLPAGSHWLHFVVNGRIGNATGAAGTYGGLVVQSIRTDQLSPGYSRVSLEIDSGTARLSAEDVDTLWNQVARRLGGVQLMCMRAARPGYFARYYAGARGGGAQSYDFEVVCPAPECPTEVPWAEGAPAGQVQGSAPAATSPTGGLAGIATLPGGHRFCGVLEAFRSASPYLATRAPIPAYTVDEQVYGRCPSLLIATVDKFARPAFEPRASHLFGQVDHHHCVHGYYRFSGTHPTPTGRSASRTFVPVPPLPPPELILQDELHLVEGPLGSMVGLYETAVDFLARGPEGHPVKYIASTATVRQAGDQVRSIFDRRLAQFPPTGLTIDESYFVRFGRARVLDDASRGRLYMGICAPGKGPLTPVLRIWSRLLQTAQENRADPMVDGFWTLAGYFNAVRELAGARALYRQDIPERLQRIAGVRARRIPEERSQELSGRTESTQLPTILDALNRPHGEDALFATSMFGTGVDVPRLGLMVVHGQPKSTSSYIQATGRVGRERGALVTTFLRATRPRDLVHYEFFLGYHLQMHRFVEPVTVMPFAPGALDRGSGPVAVTILRNRGGANVPWHEDGAATEMRSHRQSADVAETIQALESRALSQPHARRPAAGSTQARSGRDFDRWWTVAQQRTADLCYVEYGTPQRAVVLGDAQHQHSNLPVVFRNAPTSLRDIEETCGFQTR